MASVTLRGLSKSYGKTKAIQDLNLVVEDGEFFVLLGPSGAGKTTTLALIAGLETPDTGEIFLGDDSLAGIAPWHRDVAMAFESYALYPHLSVYDNIAFPLRSPVRLPRLQENEIKERVQQIAAMLQIDHLLDRRPSQLSGGQRQRTSLGRMLVRQPRVFLMDEPIVHLDAKLRHHMRGELKQLHEHFPTTTLYATPDWIEAVAMGHRIAVLQRGHVVQVGTPDEIFHRPVNRFVADFVGEPPMNILNGRLVRADDSIRFDIGGATIPLGRDLGQTLDETAGGTEWQLGVRPSAIRLDMTNGKAGAIPAAVFVSEPLGRDTIIETRLERQSIAVKAPGLITLEPGTRVWLTIDSADIHLFDTRSGLALRRGAASAAPVSAPERFIG